MTAEISPTVRAFLTEHIHSVAKLELLLLLARDAAKPWNADEAARIFGLSPEMTAGLLAELVRGGLATAAPDARDTCTYASGSAQRDQTVHELAALYQERRVTLIQLIYAPQVDKMTSFADAFDLRKKRGEN
jgi:hypothetical protein